MGFAMRVSGDAGARVNLGFQHMQTILSMQYGLLCIAFGVLIVPMVYQSGAHY